MRRILCTLLLSVDMLLPSKMTVAQGGSFPSIWSLTHSGNLIVVGTGAVQKSADHEFTATVKVLRTIKGEAPANGILTLDLKSPCVEASVSDDFTGLWLLTKGADGSYAISDATGNQQCHPLDSSLEMERSSAPAEWVESAAPKTVEDKLAVELAWSVHQHEGRGPFLAVINPAFLDDASENIQQALGHHLYQSQNPAEHRIGLISLLKSGNLDALAEVASLKGSRNTTAEPTSFLLKGKLVPFSYGNKPSAPEPDPWIGLRLSQITSTNDAVVTKLIAILSTATEPSIRDGAAVALQNIHTPSATAALTPYLSSEIASLRYAAIGAVASFVNAVPVIDPKAEFGGFDLNKPGPYKTDETALHFGFGSKEIKRREDYYLTYWKQWVRTHPDGFRPSS